MDAREKILGFIQQNGPSVPTAIAKQLESNSFFASAYLSEMKDGGKVRISSLKFGGSPLYYLPGQEEQLQRFADNLGEKEKRVYDLLKERGVLQDSKLVPVFRAAIRAIKDFAVQFNFNNEVLWRWSLLSENATKAILGVKKELPKKPVRIDEKKPEKILVDRQERLERKEEKTEEKDANEEPKEWFIDEVRSYFSNNKINVIEEKIIRRTDIEFIVEVPSPVGSLKYYVKAKSKKRINDGDLSSVFIHAQSKRMPALFLGKGELTKKARELLDKEFKGMRYNKI